MGTNDQGTHDVGDRRQQAEQCGHNDGAIQVCAFPSFPHTTNLIYFRTDSMMLINSLMAHSSDGYWEEFIANLERLNVRKSVIVRV